MIYTRTQGCLYVFVGKYICIFVENKEIHKSFIMLVIFCGRKY